MLAIATFFLFKGRSVSSSFILGIKMHSVNENEDTKLILNKDEKKVSLTGDITAGIPEVSVDFYISLLNKTLSRTLTETLY